MTDEERDKLITAKDEVTSYLSKVDLKRYKLSKIDVRLSKYIRDIARHPQEHNVFEQLGVKHFLHMMEKYGFELCIFRREVALYEALSFPGKNGLQTYKLTPVQIFQFASIYGFWKDGRRVVTEVAEYVPRKFSKTTSAAHFIVDDFLFGDANSEGYIAANSQDQAKKGFNVVRDAIKKLDPHGDLYRVNEMEIKSLRQDRTSSAQCLTANASTKDGLNASTIVMDEFAQAKDGELFNVLTTSMGVRLNPLTVIITTASDNFDGPFFYMLEGYKGILLGDYEDDSVFAHIFEPDINDPEDSEKTWLKVHPHLGVTVNIEFYRKAYRKAQREGADAMLAFRTKLLNIFCENESLSWISGTLARDCSRHLSIDGIKGRPDAMVAFDLSERDDFSAVSMGMYSYETKSFFYHTAYFFPEGALPGHPNEKLYRLWASRGYLILTKGNVIDYRSIVDYILYLNKHVRILGIGYDGWKSLEVVNMLAASGASGVLKAIKQTYGVFTAPVESFEHGMHTGHIFINNNPINAYCFGNAILDTDKLENKKPIKRQAHMKIDGVITMLMCHRQFIDFER